MKNFNYFSSEIVLIVSLKIKHRFLRYAATLGNSYLDQSWPRSMAQMTNDPEMFDQLLTPGIYLYSQYGNWIVIVFGSGRLLQLRPSFINSMSTKYAEFDSFRITSAYYPFQTTVKAYMTVTTLTPGTRIAATFSVQASRLPATSVPEGPGWAPRRLPREDSTSCVAGLWTT